MSAEIPEPSKEKFLEPNQMQVLVDLMRHSDQLHMSSRPGETQYEHGVTGMMEKSFDFIIAEEAAGKDVKLMKLAAFGLGAGATANEMTLSTCLQQIQEAGLEKSDFDAFNDLLSTTKNQLKNAQHEPGMAVSVKSYMVDALGHFDGRMQELKNSGQDGSELYALASSYLVGAIGDPSISHQVLDRFNSRLVKS